MHIHKRELPVTGLEFLPLMAATKMSDKMQ